QLFSWGNPIAATSVTASVAMDVPMSHWSPALYDAAPTEAGSTDCGGMTIPITTTTVPLRPANHPYRAYPAQLVIVRTSEGRISLVEIEEFDRMTVGLRGLVTFASANVATFELAGGAELYPDWGIDADYLGVTKWQSSIELSNPGFNTFFYTA